MIGTVILIIIALIIITIILKIIKNVLKAVFLIISLAVIILMVGGVLVFREAKEFSQQLSTNTTQILLYDDNGIIAGMEIAKMSEGTTQKVYDNQEIEEINKLYKEGNYESIKKNNFLTMYIHLNITKNLPESVEIEGLNVSKEEIIEALTGKNDTLLKTASLLTGEDEGKIKGALLGICLYYSMEKEGPAYIIKATKEGIIRFYPESTTTKLIRIVPSSIVEKIMPQEEE